MNKIKMWGKLALVGLTAASLVACGGSEEKATAKVEKPAQVIHWKMVTTWPKNFPGLGTGAEALAKNINEMSNGRINIKVYATGELVPSLNVFSVVYLGPAQMGQYRLLLEGQSTGGALFHRSTIWFHSPRYEFLDTSWRWFIDVGTKKSPFRCLFRGIFYCAKNGLFIYAA